MFKREIIAELKKTIEEDKKPVLLTGARQVGKTTVVKELSKEYKSSIYINLESNNTFKQIVDESNLDFYEIMNAYCAISNISLLEDTLVIFDEIQFSSKLLTGLKYFYESDVANTIIATGSNLGLSINKEDKWSFPVGKVSMLNMYPMNFKEFLFAVGKAGLISYIESGVNGEKILGAVHDSILREFDVFINTGGMPEVVAKYVQTKDLKDVKKVQEGLLLGYNNDILKYSDSKTSSRIYEIYDSVDAMLSSDTQKFKITKVDANTYKDIASPLSWLIKTGLVYKCNNIESISMPLSSNVKENNFKLFYSDVGLLMKKSNYTIGPDIIENDKIYLGVVMENYFATIIKYNNQNLFCYKRRTSEIDFIIEYNSKVIPVEVKSGNNTQAKSLKTYIERYKPSKAYKFSRNNFSVNGIVHCFPVYSFEFIKEFV